MQRMAAISLALVFGAAVASGQAAFAQAIDQYQPRKFSTEPPSGAKWTIIQMPPIPADPACPVQMRATQGSGQGALVAVKPGQPDPDRGGNSQRIHLAVNNTGAARIRTADVRVHGTTAMPRMVPLAGASGPATITRGMHVSFSEGTGNESSSDVVLRDFTSVRSIDLLSVTYADGTTWKSSAGACRIVPDPVMLIGAR